MILHSLVMNCTEPEVVANADIGLSNGTNYGSVLTYTCQTGYEKTSGDYSLLCNILDGSIGWNGSFPTCSGLHCYLLNYYK